MSTTLQDVEDVIRAYITDSDDADEGAILTDWIVLAATYVPALDDIGNGYWKLIPTRQAIHTSLGLIEQARHTYLANGVTSTNEGDDQ